MNASRKVLVVGGGIGGMSSAIQLARAGWIVSLVEADPEWRVYGTGITITGPTFRAFRQMGLMEEVMARGFPGRGARARTQEGVMVAETVSEDLEPGVPDGGGILRPVLHQILSERTLAEGVDVRLGQTFETIGLGDDGSEVTFTDGRADRYDLVVGADGINSRVRAHVFPEAPQPRFTGQGAWRVLAPRPPELNMTEMYLGSPIKAGVTPLSNDQLYLFTLSPEADGAFIPPEDQPGRLREVLSGFGGAIGDIRDSLGEASPIVYRPLQIVLLPPPWHRGRVVLLGDAVHATTPHLGSGAGCAVEDAIVLAEELAASDDVEQALIAYTDRRFERCRDVVETSAMLGEMELAGTSVGLHAQLIAAAMKRLAAPI